MLELKAKKRNIKERPETLREGGILPAVFYGKKNESTPISIAYQDFIKVWQKAGESSVVTLKTENGDVDTLIHDIDIDPVSGKPRHADFYVFDKDKKIEVSVPIEFIGISSGVKDHGGLLVKVLYEIKIEALPANLPHKIEVDISPLAEIGNQIHAKDIVMPEGVTLLENSEEVVVLVDEQKEEEVPIEEVDLSSIEVEKKGKEKEEGEGVEESAEEKKSE